MFVIASRQHGLVQLCVVERISQVTQDVLRRKWHLHEASLCECDKENALWVRPRAYCAHFFAESLFKHQVARLRKHFDLLVVCERNRGIGNITFLRFHISLWLRHNEVDKIGGLIDSRLVLNNQRFRGDRPQV